jgi:cell division protein ZapA (FtsZ GTPase activity inhibitor)
MDSASVGKKLVRVSIFNQSYSLRAPGDPREIEELASQVDSLMESIASRSGDVDPARVAVLVSLHLADRLRAVEQQLTDLKQRVDHKAGQLSLLLDEAIQGSE